jgi:hypothetical protein
LRWDISSVLSSQETSSNEEFLTSLRYCRPYDETLQATFGLALLSEQRLSQMGTLPYGSWL